MEPQETIKAVIPHFCPNCNQEIFVKIHALPPQLASVLNRKAIMDAKNEVLSRLLDAKLSSDDMHRARVEIMDENVLFGPEDVEGIISQYTKEI